MEIRGRRERIEARDVDPSSSVFDVVNLSDARLHNVNLAGSVFDDVNFSNATLRNLDIHGMTVEGVPVEDLFAAYEARTEK